MNTLYLASNHANAGSIVITMGLMQLLKSKISKVAFFRPIIDTSPEENHDIRFMKEYFSLPQSYDESFGITFEDLEEKIASGKRSEALERIIASVEKLKAQNDFVLIEGISPSSHFSGLGFDINLELAKNLDSDYIVLLNGASSSLCDIQQHISIEADTLHASGVRLFMMIVNRISPPLLSQIELKKFEDIDLYLAPEVDELSTLTLQDIHTHLDSELIFGEPKDLTRVLQSKLVAGMNSDHFLSHITEKALIIVPADRTDILTVTILSLYSKNYPNIAGIVLSGNISLSDSIVSLLQGLDLFSLPILATPLDTYQCATHIEAITSTIYPSSERKIALAMGLFYKYIDTDKLLGKLGKQTEHIMTPAMFQYTLFEKARAYKKRIILPESEDERILRAAEIILRRGVAEIVLLGNPTAIHQHAGLLGLDITQAHIIDPDTSDLRDQFAEEFYQLRSHKGLQLQAAHDAMAHGNYFATMMVHKGLADGMVSGASHTTADTIRPALQIIKTRPNISVVSSVFFMCLETQVLVYGDCAINQNPSSEELAQIALSSAQTARSFGISPRVAMLSYSTGESGSGEEVEKVKIATRIAQSAAPDIPIDGPLQYDAAIDPDVSALKLPHSHVAGKANVLIFPDLNTGNNTYKAVQRSAGVIAIGPVLQGLNKPINDLSRGCSVTDIVNTIAITAIQAKENR